MSGPAFIGFQNAVAAAHTVVTTTGFSGLVPAEMAASWLKTEEPSDRARLALLDPYHTRWMFDFRGIATDVDGMALVNLNLFQGSEVRFLGSTITVPGPNFFRDSPSSIASSTNVTGGLSNVDETTDSPDGLVMTPTTSGSAWSVTFNFSVPPVGTVASASRSAAFVLRVKRVDPAAQYAIPQVACNLREGGVLRASLGYRAIHATATTQILIFPFSLNSLASPLGAHQCELLFSPGLGDALGPNSYGQLESIEQITEGASGAQYDSEWISIDTADGPTRPVKNADYFPPTAWTGVVGLAVLVRTDQAAHDPPRDSSNRVPASSLPTPVDFAQAGVFCAGPGLILEHGIRPDAGPGGEVLVEGLAGTTAGGQSYGADGFRRRAVGPLDLLVTREEATFIEDQIAWARGRTGAFYFSAEPSVAYRYREFVTFWATAKNVGPPVKYGRYKPDGTMLMRLSLSVEEKL